MCDLPAGFDRAEQSHLYNTPENTPDYDDWVDGRDEIETLLTRFFKILEELSIEPSSGMEARKYLDEIKACLPGLERIVDRVEMLEDDYPPEYSEPEPDYDSMPGGHDWVE